MHLIMQTLRKGWHGSPWREGGDLAGNIDTEDVEVLDVETEAWRLVLSVSGCLPLLNISVAKN